MKKSIAFTLFSCLLFINCATPKVTYDYDRSVNFSTYKTFNFKTRAFENVSKIDSQRIFSAIETQMKSKGLNLSETPDLYISIMRATRTRKKQRGSIGIGLGQWTRNIGINIGTSLPITGQVNDTHMQMEISDAASNHLIWEGVFDSTSPAEKNPVEKQESISRSIHKLLENFPPK